MKMGSMKLNATLVGRLLIASILLLIAGTIYGCMQLQTLLTGYTIETNHAKTDASVGNNELQNMMTLKDYLDTHKSEVDRAANIVANTKSYQYQNQIVQDLTVYANNAGVTIGGFTFPDPAVAAPVQTGAKSIQATIALKSPMSYTNYIKFLRLIESNLTKMQITDITVSPNELTPGQINAPTIGLKIYVR